MANLCEASLDYRILDFGNVRSILTSIDDVMPHLYMIFQGGFVHHSTVLSIDADSKPRGEAR